MKAIAIAMALLAGLASGCASTLPKEPSSVIDVDFACTNGETISVRYQRDPDVAVLLRNGDAIELPQQRSGSGFIYSNGPNTIRGKGDALTVEIGRMVPLHCTAIR
jgi:membrane-bound inhibitor of C-type lysozyme